MIALAATPRAVRGVLTLAQEDPERGVPIMMLFVAPFTLLGLLGGTYAVSRSVRAVRSRQFPPPGMRVLRDTRVLRGRPAHVMGVVGLWLGSVLLLASTTLPWLAYRIGTIIQHGCPRAAAR